jgi:hypothetical protein
MPKYYVAHLFCDEENYRQAPEYLLLEITDVLLDQVRDIQDFLSKHPNCVDVTVSDFIAYPLILNNDQAGDLDEVLENLSCTIFDELPPFLGIDLDELPMHSLYDRINSDEPLVQFWDDMPRLSINKVGDMIYKAWDRAIHVRSTAISLGWASC